MRICFIYFLVYKDEDISFYFSLGSTMTSLTLSLTGNSSELTANYFPPIVLDSNAEYVCGLVNFQTINKNESNNRLYRVIDSIISQKTDGVTKLNPMNVIKIECNITSGSYSNDSVAHTIYDFYPSIPFDHRIVEVPRNVIYLPLTKNVIDNLTVRLVDQNNQLINFRGVDINLRLHIKKI